MKPKHQRLALLGLGVLVLGAAAALVLTAFEDNLVFFHTPSELATKQIAPQQRLRIGGLVQDGSVVKNGSEVRFVVTDGAHSVPVAYRGLLPDLFREGQGVVAEGTFANGTFTVKGTDKRLTLAEVAKREPLAETGQFKTTSPTSRSSDST